MFLVRQDLGPSQCTMELQRGDWVKTESGEAGKAIHISRLTVFVAFAVPGKDDRVDAFLESQLTKTAPPNKRAPQ